MPLSKALGGVKNAIEIGDSVGIQSSPDNILKKNEDYVKIGYKRIKVKNMPDWDVEIIKLIRQHFPTIPLMADANCAYTLQDIDHLKKLDQFDLMMIEQPLA
ncbi:enolase C-terminal domain-like protein, partial [Planococcus sp. SIMBA_143]